MSLLPIRDKWDLDKLPRVVQTSYPVDRKNVDYVTSNDQRRQQKRTIETIQTDI